MKVSYKYTVLFIFLFANFNLFATKYTWTGNSSTDWSTSTNWSPNGVPSTTDSVKIVTRTNAPVVGANTTVKELDMTSGSISLGGYSLTVTNNAYFYAGTLSNGTLVLRGSYALFNGSTFNVTIDAIAARTEFSGGVFNYPCSFEQTGTSTTNGAGGCTFNAAVTIKKSGASYLTMGVTSADIFNSTLKVINTATYAVQLGYNTVASFYDSLIFENSSASGISIGGGNTNGGGHIYNGKKIAIGTGGFTAGLLTLKNFIQTGTGQQSFVTTGSAITSLAGCSFEGDLTITSPGILLKTSTFNGTTEFIRSSTSSSYSDGGNTFNGTTTFRNNATNTASFRLGVQTGDQYNGNVSFISTTGYIQPAYSGTSEFKGNVSITSSLVLFNSGAGKMLCTGANNQTFSTSGSFTYLVAKFGVNKSSGAVTFNAPITIDSLLELTSGNINTSSSNLLTLKAAGTLSGGSTNSYIAGPIKKIGNSTFKFPLGKGTDYRPVSITAPSNATDAFTAEYFNTVQTNGTAKDTSINYISECNYWNVTRTTGSSNVALTFNWYKSSCDVFDIDSTKLVRWNGSKWVDGGLMNYTGNDSVGSVTTPSSISYFGNFVFGHKLVPRLSFDFIVDSSASPTNVKFINTSRGIAPGTEFIWRFGQAKSGKNDSLVVFDRNVIEYIYLSDYSYTVDLICANAGQFAIVSKNVNLQSNPMQLQTVDVVLTFTQSDGPLSSTPIPIPTNPNPCTTQPQQLSSCFTPILGTGVTISPMAPGESLELEFPSYISDINSFISLTTGLIGVPNTSVIPQTLTISNGLSSVLSAGASFTFTLISNTCNSISNRNNFSNNQKVKVSSSKQYINLVVNGAAIPPSSSTPYVNNFTLVVFTPTLQFDVLSSTSYGFPTISSKDKGYLSLNEEGYRYYRIKPIEGIVDFFELKIDLESDLELLSIDAIDPSLDPDVNPNPISHIFPDGGGQTAPLIGGSSFKIHFYNPNSPDFTANPLNTSNESYAQIGSCVAPAVNSPALPCSTLYNYLIYHSPTEYNYIVIREKVRLKKILGCDNTPIASSNSTYSLKIVCDDVPNSTCLEGAMTPVNLDINEITPPIKLTESIKKLDASSSPSVYNSIENSLGVCSSSIVSDKVDYSLVIKNSTTATSFYPDPNATTIKLKKVDLYFSPEYFEWDNISSGEIWYGNQQLNVQTETTGTGWFHFIIDFDLPAFDGLLTLNNPNLDPGNVNLGVANSAYGLPGSYTYLNAGNEIGFTLKNFSFKDCGSGTVDPLMLKDDKYDNHIISIYETDVEYYTMCDLAVSPRNWNTDHKTSFGKDLASFRNITTSYISHSSIVGGGDAQLTIFSEIPSTSFPYDRPWLMGSNMFSCPNRKNYAIVEYISHDGYDQSNPSTPTTTPLITLSNVKVTYKLPAPNVPSTLQVNAIATQYLGLNKWRIDLPDPGNFPAGLSWPDFVNVNIDAKITMICPTDESFGLDEINTVFIESCDDACSDCYIQYADASSNIFRHCIGSCPVDDHVTTSNFSIERKTFGWPSKADYDAQINNTPPSSPPAGVTIKADRVYPYDVVNLSSLGGTFGGDELASDPAYQAPYGIADLQDVYFDFRYRIVELPLTNPSSANNYRALFNKLSAYPNGGGFSFTVTNLKTGETPLNGIVSGTVFHVGPNNIDIENDIVNDLPVGGTPLFAVVKFKANAASQPIPNQPWTLRQILEIYSCNVDFNLDVEVENMGKLGLPTPAYDYVNIGHYKFDPAFGLFSYTTSTSGGILQNHYSCDPWTDGFEYLQIHPEFYKKFLGCSSTDQFAPYTPGQCDLAVDIRPFLTGGYNVHNLDFPNEYRPIFSVPQTVSFSSTNNLLLPASNSSSWYFRDLNYSSLYTASQTGNTGNLIPSTTPQPALPPPAPQKLPKAMEDQTNNIFRMIFKKDCNSLPNANTKITLDQFPIFFGAWADKSIIVPGLTASTSSPVDVNYIVPTPIDKEEYTITVKLTNTIQNILTNPSAEIPIEILYHSNTGTAVTAEFPYIYFTPNNGLHYKLFRNGLQIMPLTNTSGCNQDVFPLEALIGDVKANYSVILDWTNCSFVSSVDRTFELEAHVGLACKGYDLLDFCALPYCNEFGSSITSRISKSRISALSLIGPTSIQGCDPFSVTANIISQEADISNGKAVLTLDDGLFLIANGSTAQFDAKINNVLTLVSVNLGTVNTLITQNNNNGYIFEFDLDEILTNGGIFPPLHFNKDELYSEIQFNFLIHPNGINGNMPSGSVATYGINFDLNGKDLCGVDINEHSSQFSVNHINFQTGIQITGASTPLCVNSSLTLSVDLNGHTASSYLWSDGSVSSSINVSSPGAYSVTVFDGTCYFQSAVQVISGPSTILPLSAIQCNSTPVTVSATPPCSTCTYSWNTSPVLNTNTVSLLAGNYSVNITDASTGCSVSRNIDVLNSSLSANIVSSDPAICRSAPLVIPSLSANASSSDPILLYHWTFPDLSTSSQSSIIANQIGNYTLFVANSAGCSVSASLPINDITPSVYFSPNVITSSGGGQISTLPAIVNNVFSSTAYLWSDGFTGGPTNNVTASANTTYTITVTNTLNGQSCEKNASVQVDVNSLNQRCSYFNQDILPVEFMYNHTISSGNYNISDDIHVTSFVTIGANSVFAVLHDKTIYVEDGAVLYIEFGAHFFSCADKMWNGIVVKPGGRLHFNSNDPLHPAIIENAKIGIEGYESPGKNTSIWLVGNVILNANNIGMYLHDGDFSDCQITARFKCDLFLESPFNTNIYNRYTQVQFKAVNAGTIYFSQPGLHWPGVYRSYFEDAYSLMDIDHTNIEVQGCYFNQNKIKNILFLTKSSKPAIVFNGASISEPNIDYFFNFNANASSGQPNRVENCFVAIRTINRAKLEISGNEIFENYFGVDVGNNGLSSVSSSKNGIIRIYSNSFKNCKYNAIELHDNSSAVEIKFNYFNNGLTFDPLKETAKAIYVHNGLMISALNTNFIIFENTIQNCKSGIHVMNQQYGKIEGNIISYFVPDNMISVSSVDYRRGIWTSGCHFMDIKSNAIQRPFGSSYHLDANTMINQTPLISGISLQNSDNNVVQNEIHNLPASFAVQNVCLGSLFECNTMDNCLEGVKLDFGYISDQGTSNHPNGNVWTNWPSNMPKISGNPWLQLILWYYNSSYPATNPGTIPVNNIVPTLSNGIPCATPLCCEAERLHVILNGTDTTDVDAEKLFAIDSYLYRTLKDSLQLLYSGATYDVQLQNYFTLLALSNIGELENVTELMRNNDFANSYLQNESLLPTHLPEINLQIVNRICAQYQLDFTHLDSLDYQALISIAYQNALIGGEAVYRARAILGIDVDDTQLAYRITNPVITNARNDIEIYPNPSSGKVTVNCNLEEGETAIVRIVDTMGKLVKLQDLKSGGNKITLTNAKFANGLYNFIVTTSHGRTFNNKILLNK